MANVYCNRTLALSRREPLSVGVKVAFAVGILFGSLLLIQFGQALGAHQCNAAERFRQE